LQVCAAYKNKENIDLSKVPAFKRDDADSGSTEVQIARLSARVEQISMHMRQNKKDYSSKRGLEAVLAQRKKLMKYLYKTNREAYDRLVVQLGIRSVIAADRLQKAKAQ